jgi:hypothetical protein
MLWLCQRTVQQAEDLALNISDRDQRRKIMRTSTTSGSPSRIVHYAKEGLAASEFLSDANWNVYRGSGVPILWDDDSDDAVESTLKFDPVLFAASEWTSTRD